MKKQGRLRRAAATAAQRSGQAHRRRLQEATAESNRSTYRPETPVEGEEHPKEACCGRCGVRGEVKPWR
jgi:hypothetical protein